MTERWVCVADADEIPESGRLGKIVENLELALFRVGERIYCLEDVCPHRGAALSEGTILSGEIICPWHGWRYALMDGACTTLPGSQPAKTFEVRVEDGRVWAKLDTKPGEGTT